MTLIYNWHLCDDKDGKWWVQAASSGINYGPSSWTGNSNCKKIISPIVSLDTAPVNLGFTTAYCDQVWQICLPQQLVLTLSLWIKVKTYLTLRHVDRQIQTESVCTTPCCDGPTVLSFFHAKIAQTRVLAS